jgi:hypothetical protein
MEHPITNFDINCYELRVWIQTIDAMKRNGVEIDYGFYERANMLT